MAKVVTDTSGGFYDANRYDSYIQQQLQTIVRPDILADAIDQLPPGTWRGANESQQSAVSRLQSALKVERVLGSYQVSISLTGGDPNAITKVVNAVTASYLKKGRSDELAQSDQQLQILEDDRQHIQAELEQDHEEQDRLGAQLGVADPGGEESNPFDTQIEDMRKQVLAARAARSFADAQLASVTTQGAQGTSELAAAADDSTLNDPGLVSLKSQINQRRGQLISQMAGMTSANPIYHQDAEELKTLTDSLDMMTSDLSRKAAPQIQSKLKLDASRAADVETRLENQLAKLKANAAAAVPKLQEANDLALAVHRLQTRFTEIDNAVHAIELEHSSSGMVHLSMAAVPPLKPEPNKNPLFIAVAFPTGVVFGVLAAILRHKNDPRVYIAEDIKKTVEFSPMAVIPSETDVAAKVTDEFLLRLVAGIDQTHRVAEARTYVFTAASSKTDITQLVASLAKKMNRLGYRTMVLKASEALEAVAPEPDQVAGKWNESALSRTTESRVGPLKRTSFVIDNLERLKQRVDLLFIEAYPLLYSAETEFVARLVDATVLVAESGETTKKELKNSIGLLRRLSAQGVAVVLNDVGLRDADEDFIKTVRSAESRQTSVWHLERNSPERLRVTPDLGVYQEMEPVSQSDSLA
jgi:uncharacterized protein involved in exopolysaccharide biosynthesis